MTLPTTYRFAVDILAQLSRLDVTPILLWGTREQCMKAAEERINKKNRPFDRPRYEEKNEPTFRLYGGREYDAFRVEAFREDGSRFTDPKWVAEIIVRTTNNSGTADDSRSTPRE